MKTGLVVASLLTFAACAGTGPATPSRSAPVAADFHQALNSFRTGQGLAPLTPSPALTRAAKAHAADMERRGYFSHSSPGGPDGATLRARAASAGCDMGAGAENIAQGQTSEAQVFAAWQNSAGHRANHIGAAYRLYGLGRVGDTWVLKLASAC